MGRKPDRPPVSFWRHFPFEQVCGSPAVSAHLNLQSKYGLDFVKVMNDNGYPRDSGPETIRTLADLKAIKALKGTESTFALQLDVIHELHRHWVGKVFFCTTIFNTWTTLRQLIEPPKSTHHAPRIVDLDSRDERLTAFLKEDPLAVGRALCLIGHSLSNFARECIKAGANGIFLSVRDDWVDRPENGTEIYDKLVRPSDLAVLKAASAGTFNMLHICGRAVNFEAFARYPVHVLNWADRAAGPSIAYARDRATPALSGGVDNLNELAKGTPDAVAAQVRDAIRQAKHRPMLITPGCTFDPEIVPEANLRAMVDAARNTQYE